MGGGGARAHGLSLFGELEEGEGVKLPFALGPKILMADLLIGRINFGNPVK